MCAKCGLHKPQKYFYNENFLIYGILLSWMNKKEVTLVVNFSHYPKTNVRCST